MNFKFLFLVVSFSAVAALHTSCTSTKSFKEVPDTVLTAANIKQLSGHFQNRGVTNTNFRSSFWAQLTPFYSDSIVDWTNTFINLKVDNKFLNFVLLQDTVLLKSKKFKYKLQNGFVVFKNNRLQGVPLLFYRYQKSKNRLTLDKENNIKMYMRGSSEGGILIFIFGSPIIADYKFLRVK